MKALGQDKLLRRCQALSESDVYGLFFMVLGAMTETDAWPTFHMVLTECLPTWESEADEFDVWFRAFQAELALQSGGNVIPKGMDQESYRESFNEGMTPAERATQELEDLARS